MYICNICIYDLKPYIHIYLFAQLSNAVSKSFPFGTCTVSCQKNTWRSYWYGPCSCDKPILIRMQGKPGLSCRLGFRVSTRVYIGLRARTQDLYRPAPQGSCARGPPSRGGKKLAGPRKGGRKLGTLGLAVGGTKSKLVQTQPSAS